MKKYKYFISYRIPPYARIGDSTYTTDSLMSESLLEFIREDIFKRAKENINGELKIESVIIAFIYRLEG